MNKNWAITVDLLGIALKLAPEIADGIRGLAQTLKDKNGISDDEWNEQRSTRELLESEILADDNA